MYQTTERTALTQFTIPLDYDDAYMVVPREGVQAVQHRALGHNHPRVHLHRHRVQARRPIASEGRVEGDRREESERVGVMRAASTSAAVSRAQVLLISILDSAYTGVLDLFSGGLSGDREGDTLAQRMLALPFTFFVTIVLAAYTANLAAFLSRVTVDMPFRNVRECADKGCTFCTDNYALAKTQLDSTYTTRS